METNSYLDFEINYGRTAMKILRFLDYSCGKEREKLLLISINIIF